MKLLFDQNLSFKLVRLLAKEFPASDQVRLLGLADADDRAIWDHAGTNGFIVVSYDADFAELAALLGPPPKVVWLRTGNQASSVIAAKLRERADAILAFSHDPDAACLEIY